MIRQIPIMAMLSCLLGCTTSPTIFSIGANSISGSAALAHKSGTIQLPLKQSELRAHDDAGFLMPGYPYQSLTSIEPSIHISGASFQYEDIEWENDYQGKIQISINGQLKEFEVWQNDNELRLKHYYRDWYGYPAQALLALSYPIDLVLVVVGGTVFVLTSPFLYLDS